MPKLESSVRLYAILARNAPCAVVFRRGPSKRVLLIRWNTDDDTFECGQWLKGRIYERRCDLSPEGDLLLYFAANFRKPYYSWTAISRPPFLTALVLWPKGDCWGGGGHFLSRKQIALNHRSHQHETTLAEGFSLPTWMKVRQFGDRPGWGEDEPVCGERLKRDGWLVVSEGKTAKMDYKAKVWHELDPPIIFRRPHPQWPKRYGLEMMISGFKEMGGPMYLTEHSILREKGPIEELGRSEWADWSQQGDLVFAKGGGLFRLHCKKGVLAPLDAAVKIADFSKLQFEPREAPWEARHWPSR